jgi:integrase
LIDPEEIQRLLAACAEDLELETFVQIALDTGARADEIAHLQWADLDLAEGVGVIRFTDTWRTKTMENRPIAFTPPTVDCLKRWRLQRAVKTHVLYDEGDRRRKVYEKIREKFQKAVTKAQLNPPRRLDDLRRTVGTLLAEQNINEKVAAAILGHRDIATTSRFYQKIRASVVKETVLGLRRMGTTPHSDST